MLFLGNPLHKLILNINTNADWSKINTTCPAMIMLPSLSHAIGPSNVVKYYDIFL